MDNHDAEFLWEVHKYTNEYIRFADTKAAFTAGTATALIGSMLASSMFDSCFRMTPCHWSVVQWIGTVGMLLLSASAGLSVAAIKPRLWNPASIGFIFWGSITGHGTAKEFTKALSAQSAQERAKNVSDHLFVLAAIAKRKYSYVDRAIVSGVTGATFAAIALFLQHALK